MKLRNKKTGEIVDLSIFGITLNIRKEEQPTYHSIEGVCEDWEDYKPTEPLIKDKKSRKVFQEWADLFGAEQFRVNHFSDSRRKTTSIGSTDSVTEPVIELPGHIGEDSEIYTKEELCGEEQE